MEQITRETAMEPITREFIPKGTAFLSAALAPDAVTLKRGARVMTYRGGATVLLRRLLPLLDGTKSILDLAVELGGTKYEQGIIALCSRLAQDGFIEQVSLSVPKTDTGSDGHFWSASGGRGAIAGIYGPRVKKLIVVGDPDQVEETCRATRDTWTVEPESLESLAGAAPILDSIVVVWVADANSSDMSEWNAHAYHHRQPWLPISQFDGEVAIVGPFVNPPETPCFECYRRRRAARSTIGATFLNLQNVSHDEVVLRPLTTLLAAIAAIQLDNWCESGNPHIPGAVQAVTLDKGLTVETEYVLRVPRCEACRPGSASGRPTLWTETFGRQDAK